MQLGRDGHLSGGAHCVEKISNVAPVLRGWQHPYSERGGGVEVWRLSEQRRSLCGSVFSVAPVLRGWQHPRSQGGGGVEV